MVTMGSLLQVVGVKTLLLLVVLVLLVIVECVVVINVGTTESAM